MASSSPVLDRKVPLRSVLVLMGLAVMVTHQISHSAHNTSYLSNTERSDNTSVANNSLFVQQPNTELLAVLVLSRRSAFDRRAVIRDTWGKGHDNLNFFVGEHYCPLHPDERVEWTCDWNKKNVSQEAKDKYIAEELAVTGRLRKEPRVVLLPMEDYYRNLAEKVKLCYVWALEHTRSKWFLKTDDDSYVRVAIEVSANAGMELLGVAFCSVQGSMGEASLLALAGKYDNKAQDEASAESAMDDGSVSKKGKCITAFASGTGLAGVFGFAFKAFFTQFLGITLQKTLLLANALAFCYWGCYWNFLDAHVESMNGSSIVAGNDEDDDNAAGNAVDEEGSLLTTSSNETCATRGHSRSRDDIDGRGSGLELSHGHGRAGGLKSQDDVEPFEDEYHEVNSLHGGGEEEEEEVNIPSLSPLERLKLSASFWPYMVPLFTVVTLHGLDTLTHICAAECGRLVRSTCSTKCTQYCSFHGRGTRAIC